MVGEWLRLGAHQPNAHFRSQLDDAIQPARELVRRRDDLAAALRQMFVTDPVISQELFQHAPVVLRPARARYTSYIAHQRDIVFAQQVQEMLERMPAMSEGVDYWLRRWKRWFTQIQF